MLAIFSLSVGFPFVEITVDLFLQIHICTLYCSDNVIQFQTHCMTYEPHQDLIEDLTWVLMYYWISALENARFLWTSTHNVTM